VWTAGPTLEVGGPVGGKPATKLSIDRKKGHESGPFLFY
jgi:hypothetical protein